MKKIGEVLQMKNIDTGEYYTPNITANLNWNLKSNVVDKTKYFATQEQHSQKNTHSILKRERQPSKKRMS